MDMKENIIQNGELEGHIQYFPDRQVIWDKIKADNIDEILEKLSVE